jgi:hypothetical protein
LSIPVPGGSPRKIRLPRRELEPVQRASG